ncbi:NAD(P)-dependent oxidoreductase [Fulvitalea axinellae]|uniref:dTDP-4-dehydrorhamnose reductase n=1 Tax=Fulvitalea axinellae TaxID=1182444 RepID=A0AAU9D6C1_9BACT|nr:NAD(P)-dependent oxidoreductase [Fulvitalea axinellae]
MKILITGSNGLLGQKLVSLISGNEALQLIATSRGENRLPTGDYVYESMDITDSAEVDRVISKHAPDAVINTAAMTQVDQCETEKEACRSLNVDAVKYMVEACRKAGSFFLHLSTDFIFDGEDGPYDEEAEANPLSFYGHSKLDSEALVKESGISWAIARTVLVYGTAHDMSRSNIILWVKNNLEKGNPLRVVDDQWRTPTLAEDLAQGCLLIVEKKAEGVYNISGKELLTPYDMAMKTCDFYGLDKSLVSRVNASTFSQPAKRPAKTGFIITKAETELGYKPHSFEEGMKILSNQLMVK